MSDRKKYLKVEAIEAAKEFIKKVNKLEEEYGMIFNTDNSIYLSYQSKEEGKHWDNIKLGWDGDGSPVKVKEVIKDKEYYKQKALKKLDDKEREALGL